MFNRAISFIVLLILTTIREVQACRVCYGGDPQNLKPLNFGIMSLLLIVLSVLGSFAWFFIQFYRRSRHLMS